MSGLSGLLRAEDAVGRRRNATFAAAHLAERLALFAVALMIPRDDRGLALAAAAALALLTVLRALAASAAQTHAKARLHERVGRALLARDLFRASALEDADPEAALLDGIDAGARVLASLRPALMADAIASVVIGVSLGFVVPPMWLAAFAVAIAVGAATVVAARRATIAASERAFVAQRPLVDRLVTILTGRLEIVANGARSITESALAREARAWADTEARFERSSAIASRLPLVLAAGLTATVLAAAGTVPLRELATSALVLAFAVPPFAGLARAVHELGKVTARIAPLASLLDGAPIEGSKERAPASPGPPRSLGLEGASFRYAGASVDALTSVNASFVSGAVTVLVGPNGSGKSTVLRALLALEPLREGGLTIDDASADAAALRAHVAYLPQRPYLSDRATVREALGLFAASAAESAEADAALVESLARVGMDAVLRAKHPTDPLAVRIGKLSSGQKQRIALARFLARDRAVWLMDEPDASLDAEGLALLESILGEERARRVIVVAAHAPSLARVADQVLVCDAGRVTARSSGTPA